MKINVERLTLTNILVPKIFGVEQFYQCWNQNPDCVHDLRLFTVRFRLRPIFRRRLNQFLKEVCCLQPIARLGFWAAVRGLVEILKLHCKNLQLSSFYKIRRKEKISVRLWRYSLIFLFVCYHFEPIISCKGLFWKYHKEFW